MEKTDQDQKITAIIQARMGSSRLPHKVLLPVVGKPFLWHIIHRLKSCKNIDKIIIATSTNPLDQAIEDFAIENGIDYFRGSENDLLDRLYQTCAKFKINTFIRVTADCPFVDPELVDQLTEFYFKNEKNCDLVSNIHPPTFPDGLDLEIIPFRVIKETQFKLNNTFDREWFTTYLFEKSDYKKLNYSNEQDQSKMRWTLDTPEDYEFFKKVFHHLFNPNKIFLRKDILNLLNQYQEYSGINNKFERNYAFYQALEKEESNGPKISFINNNLAGKKIMIIGCGSMGIKHLRNLNHNFKIETIACDASEKIIDEVKKEFPLQKTYLNLDEALRNEKPEYIIIATPNHLHLPLALKCLDYTKNIFIEKPISDKEEGVEKLLKQAREKGVKITVGFNMRFNPVIQKIKDLVKRDELGKITSMRINFCSYLPDRHPGKDYREDYVTKRSMGGGVILDMTHELDYLIWIFGQPIEVFSFAERRSNLEMETEDSADILIKLVSGSVANLHLDFIRRPYTRTIEVVGEKGTLLADLASNQIKVFHPERKEWEEIKFNQEHNETYIQELNHFLDFSAEEDKVSSSGESALKVLNMVNAIKESAQEGKVINIK